MRRTRRTIQVSPRCVPPSLADKGLDVRGIVNRRLASSVVPFMQVGIAHLWPKTEANPLQKTLGGRTSGYFPARPRSPGVGPP